jgi:hypothetical protein
VETKWTTRPWAWREGGKRGREAKEGEGEGEGGGEEGDRNASSVTSMELWPRHALVRLREGGREGGREGESKGGKEGGRGIGVL